MKRFWVIKNESDELSIVKSNRRPVNAVQLAPIDEISGLAEEAEWLQLEMIADEDGILRETVTVNQVLKDQILQDRVDAAATAASERSARIASYWALKSKLINLTKADLSTADNMRDAIIDIRDALKILEENIFNLQEE